MNINIESQGAVCQNIATGKDEEFKCIQCSNEIDEGYMCENNKKLIFCKNCQNIFNMTKCKHDNIGEHRHIKFYRNKEQ